MINGEQNHVEHRLGFHSAKVLVDRSPYDLLLHLTQDTCETHRTVVSSAMKTAFPVDGQHYGLSTFGGHSQCDSYLKESPDWLAEERRK